MPVFKEAEQFNQTINAGQTDFSGNYFIPEATEHGIEITAAIIREDNLYNFSLSTANLDGTCTGELSGKILLNDSLIGVYHNEEDGFCELEFQFFETNPKTIKITESECDAHGLNCSFEGIYKSK
ncbi:MAG: hypothetical protein HC905_28220 [Bacteroidales bacterium]|nr:hypothetical protein [Bacteroidales bacterium]